LQGSKDTFGTAEEIRAAIGNAREISIVELPGADHAYRVAKSSSFTAADLRSSVVAEVSRFISAVAGISTP
jgi:predicted alpha/beta-hydrolase family hydrolase